MTLLGGAHVRGLLATAGTPPTVTGVRYARDGAEHDLAADLVIDASGRHSKAPEWLAAIGAAAPVEELEQSGIVYYTRFYRFRPGAVEPPPQSRIPPPPTTTGSSTRSSRPTTARSRSRSRFRSRSRG